MQYQGPEDFFNADGSYNVAAIMTLAHAKARAAIALAVSVDAIGRMNLKDYRGCAYSPRGRVYANWPAEDAAFVATLAPELVRDIKAAPHFPRYADALAAALSDLWHAARVWKSRGVADEVRAAAAASYRLAA